MKAIFRGAWYEAVNIQNLLKENGIEVFLEDELMANIFGGANPVILKVNASDLEKAHEILDTLK